jgi:hypothetical protein
MIRYSFIQTVVAGIVLSAAASIATADVVIDMPPPARSTAAEAADTAASQASDTSTAQATADVGNIALYRYARNRSTPYDQYYMTGARRFGGYVTPTYYYRWGHPWYGSSCGVPHWSPWFWMSPGFSYQIHH